MCVVVVSISEIRGVFNKNVTSEAFLLLLIFHVGSLNEKKSHLLAIAI